MCARTTSSSSPLNPTAGVMHGPGYPGSLHFECPPNLSEASGTDLARVMGHMAMRVGDRIYMMVGDRGVGGQCCRLLTWKVKSKAHSTCIPVRTEPQLPTAVTNSLMYLSGCFCPPGLVIPPLSLAGNTSRVSQLYPSLRLCFQGNPTNTHIQHARSWGRPSGCYF